MADVVDLLPLYMSLQEIDKEKRRSDLWTRASRNGTAESDSHFTLNLEGRERLQELRRSLGLWDEKYSYYLKQWNQRKGRFSVGGKSSCRDWQGEGISHENVINLGKMSLEEEGVGFNSLLGNIRENVRPYE